VFHVKQSKAMNAIVSRETLGRLQTYASLLVKWNATINLVSKRGVEELWDRHICDALQLVPLMPSGIELAVDLGSGGGLPGLVLAIATGCHFHLVESDQRKSAFLREAARECQATVTVHTTRIESAQLPKVKLVTARALAPLPELIALAEPFLMPEGMLLAPKGRNVEAELTAAAGQWHMRVTRTASVTDPSGTILQITEVTRVGHLP
jgi:16S rRNA (guanine527-N7)-methyltransferase